LDAEENRKDTLTGRALTGSLKYINISTNGGRKNIYKSIEMTVGRGRILLHNINRGCLPSMLEIWIQLWQTCSVKEIFYQNPKKLNFQGRLWLRRAVFFDDDDNNREE
jgi:hypothetical protein